MSLDCCPVCLACSAHLNLYRDADDSFAVAIVERSASNRARHRLKMLATLKLNFLPARLAAQQKNCTGRKRKNRLTRNKSNCLTRDWQVESHRIQSTTPGSG